MYNEEIEQEFASAGVPDQDRGISSRDKGPTSREIEVLQRRELAVAAADSVAEVLGVDITIPVLQELVESDKKEVRLIGVRGLRCIESIAKENSKVVSLLGEQGIYHYVEAVMTYGASEKCYLGLVEALGTSAEHTTGLYDVREMISEYADNKPGFQRMLAVLQTLGISAYDAANDPEGAVRALEEANYFVAFAGRRTFDHAVFAPHLVGADVRIVEDDPDGSITAGSLQGQKAYFDQTRAEDEGEAETVDLDRTADNVRDFIKSNGL
jgi:hypothetical protein